MDRRKSTSSVDIQKVLLDMREYRMGLIQTPDQLRFSYMAVIEGAKLVVTDNSQVRPSQSWRVRLHLSELCFSCMGCWHFHIADKIQSPPLPKKMLVSETVVCRVQIELMA